MKNTFLYLKDNKVLIGDEHLFKSLTHATLISETIGSMDSMNSLVKTSPSEGELHVSKWVLPRYEAFRNSPKKLLLKIGDTVGHHSLIAGESIKKGEIVTEYIGEYSFPSAPTPSSYRFGPIDGLKFRNLGPQIDDGFPNLGPFYLYDTDSPLRIVFMALENINEGDTLLFSYGPTHSVKLEEREEFRLVEMFTYFKDHPLSSLSAYLKPLSQTLVQNLDATTYFEYEAHLNRLQYPFHTPKALSLLLNEGLFDKSETKAFFNRLDNRLYLLGFPILMNIKQQRVYDAILSHLQ